MFYGNLWKSPRGNKAMKTPFFLLMILLILPVLKGSTIPLPEVINPGQIKVSGNRIYITDRTSIHIYSLKGIRPERVVGKRGEGPDEFMPRVGKGQIGLHISSEFIYVCSGGKVSFLKKNGDFINVKKTYAFYDNYVKCSDKYFGIENYLEGQVEYYRLNIYDGNFQKVRNVFKIKSYDRRKKLNRVTIGKFINLVPYKDKLYVNEKQQGIIHVFNCRGEKVRTIEMSFPPVRVTGNDKKRFMSYFESDPRYKQRLTGLKKISEFPSTFPMIRDFAVYKDMLFVMTYSATREGSQTHLYDLEGGFIRKTVLPVRERSVMELNPYTIHEGKLYQLTENESEEMWELMISPLPDF